MDEFARFEQSLTPAEREAVLAWLGVWGEAIREHQLNGGGCDRTCHYERHFSTALGKAVTCTDPVFRGLSAGNWRPERIDLLCGLIRGPEEHTLEAHESASTQEEIGRSFARTEREDEERNLSVLLMISPRTAKHLRPFYHDHCEEREVVLVKGSRYRRTRAVRIPDPKPDLEFWEIEWVEIA